jgi:hypothetical protein
MFLTLNVANPADTGEAPSCAGLNDKSRLSVRMDVFPAHPPVRRACDPPHAASYRQATPDPAILARSMTPTHSVGVLIYKKGR